MKIKLHVLLCLILLLTLLTGCGSADEKNIRTCYAKYLVAFDNDDGKTAASLVSKDTIDYYGQILDCALNSSESQTHALSYWRKILVLQARARFPADELQTLAPEDYFSYTVKHNSSDLGTEKQKKQQKIFKLGKITIQGEKASVQALVNGVEVPDAFFFVKEGNNWKMDLVPGMTRAEGILAAQLQSQKISEDEMLVIALKRGGLDISPDIWKPLNKH
jgi:hypothetical protein